MAAQNDGSWFVPSEARLPFCLRVLTTSNKLAVWADSSPVASACSCASTISIQPTKRLVAAGVQFVSSPRDEPYGRLAVFLDLEGTAGTCWAKTAATRDKVADRPAR